MSETDRQIAAQNAAHVNRYEKLHTKPVPSAPAAVVEPFTAFATREFAYGVPAFAMSTFAYGDKTYNAGDRFDYKRLGLGFHETRVLWSAAKIDTPVPK